jgi:PPM family protein phosphatase
VVLTLVAGIAVAAVGWYARSAYYVGLDGDRIAIYKGRPGGLLWFEPTLQERKPLTAADVLPSRLPDLRAGREEPTKADADRYVNNLRQEAATTRPSTLEPFPTTVPSTLPAPP